MFKAGIIGTGRIAFLLELDKLREKPCTHMGALSRDRGFTVTCACDLDTGRLRAFQKQYSTPRLYTHYREMLKKEELDMVIIATWTDTHAPITIAAARQKVRLIVCEKPMAFTYRDSLRMLDACRKNGSILMINHERRFDPLFLTVKKMIMNGKLGKIRTVTANVLTQLSSAKASFRIDKSSLLHDATHLIDMALFLFGPYKNVKGLVPSGRKDTAYGHIEFRNGVHLFLEAGGDRDYFNFELDIQAVKGRIRVGNECREYFIGKRSGRYEGFHELERVKFPAYPDENCFQRLYREAIGLLRGRVRVPSSSGLDASQGIRIIEKMVRNRKDEW
ncbi:MAG: Gfo/Idh/MocA family oxidoreductase [bacterium]|nr:Gfo/Idh/MocA family oxidoreductase [bacterium]